MLSFMGLWMADGSYTKDHNALTGVAISTGNEANIVRWLDTFASRYARYSKTVVESQSNGQHMLLHLNGDAKIHRTVLATHIFSVFGNVDSYTKRVPKELFTAPIEQVASFLRGYFSGDGSIHLCNNNPKCETFKYGPYYAIDCSGVNRSLLEDISVLLDRLGIKHNISTPSVGGGFNGRYKQNLQYKLIIHVSHAVDKFMKMVGFIKQHKFVSRETYKRDITRRPVSLRSARSIEYVGEKPVYDISLLGTYAFVGNGILSSTSQSHGNDVMFLSDHIFA
jgi:intein/homing endonuclease